jgi:hypothetical protein
MPEEYETGELAPDLIRFDRGTASIIKKIAAMSHCRDEINTTLQKLKDVGIDPLKTSLNRPTFMSQSERQSAGGFIK